jgi:cytidylate kinase
LPIECRIREGSSTVEIEGVDPGAELQSREVNEAVSPVSAVREVRHRLVAKQREYLHCGDIVMEGRDIGSVVFPETPLKFYIDARPEVRAQRRAGEGGLDEILERDRMDSSREESPLCIAEGAAVIDTSDLTLDEVVAAVLAKIPATEKGGG